MKKIIRKENGSYDLIIDEKVYSNLKKSFDKRIGKNYLWIPEEVISIVNRKFIVESKIPESGELNLDDVEMIRKKSSNNEIKKVEKSNNNWIDFLNEEEKKIYDDLKVEYDNKIDRLLKEFDEKIKDLKEIGFQRKARIDIERQIEEKNKEIEELKKILGI